METFFGRCNFLIWDFLFISVRWRYKALILFKLMLLQKRVVCFGSPVRPICSLILSIASLHPELLVQGFQQVACVKSVLLLLLLINFILIYFPCPRTSRPMSPMPDFNDKQNSPQSPPTPPSHDTVTTDNLFENDQETSDVPKDELSTSAEDSKNSDKNDKNSLTRESSIDTFASTMQTLCLISPKVWNAPFPIFTNGNLCLPYLSLPYMDLLTDPSVLGYTIGTSNILFQQKKQLADVLVDVEGCTIETADQELKRLLTLSTEDLRFVDYIVRHVQAPREDAEGSELWIRQQFQSYMLAMLRTSLLPDGSKEIEHFNGIFMAAWKRANCYCEWYELCKPDDNSIFENIPSGHPFAGTLSVADMKLKIAQ